MQGKSVPSEQTVVIGLIPESSFEPIQGVTSVTSPDSLVLVLTVTSQDRAMEVIPVAWKSVGVITFRRLHSR